MKKAFIQFFLLPFAVVTFFSLTAAVAQRPGGGWGGPNSAETRVGRFYGKIIDANTGKSAEYCSVQLVGMQFDTVAKRPKEGIVGGQLTGENGEFSLENLPVFGEFTLKISCMGYDPYETKATFGLKRPGGGPGGGGAPGGGAAPGGRSGQGGGGQGGGPGGGRFDPSQFDKDLGNIKITPSSVVLKEAEIVGQAGGFSLALDKKVFKVDKNLNAAGGTAEDALRNVPSLSVDIDGNLTMRNAAPQIFVDGRPTNLTLEQIPADAIDNVELITNPSAKYDASGGSAGIVNIVLKKERRVGYNGNIRAGIDMRGRPNLGGDINARQGKFNAFLSGNLNMRRSLGTSETDRNNLFGLRRTNVYQDGESENNRMFVNVRTGFDWFINNRNTLTFAANVTNGRNNNDDLLQILTDTLATEGTSIVGSSRSVRDNRSKRQFLNPGGQILYKKLFPTEGRELTADINFNASRFDNSSEFYTTYLSSNTKGLQTQEGTGGNNFITAQTDYTTPLGKGLKLETGARAAIRTFSSKNANYQLNPTSNELVRVSNFADEYAYLDQVYAAYGTFSHSFKRWGYQVGLRAERSRYDGELPITDQSFGNSYPLALFPSVFTTYKLNEEDNIQLNYSRRINRPNFFQLIPFPDFSDSLLLSRGNPDLVPEFTNALEFSYQNIINRNHNFLASVYYRRATNLITRYQFNEFNEFLGREAVVSTFANANSGYAYGGELTVKNTLGKMLELTTNINLFNSVLNAENVEASLRNEQFSWNFKENINLRLPKDWSFQVSGEYESRTALSNFSSGGGGGHGGWREGPSNTAQGYRIPVWSIDLSVRKQFWNKKAGITLSCNDIFRSRINGNFSENTSFIQQTERLRDPQFFRLNFNYRFGKFDVSLFKRKNTRQGGGDGMEF
jgi:outer membrane receptor protein involved in Fe transport